MATGRLAVFAGYPEVAIIYAATSCNIAIDGKRERRPWGLHEYELEAGRHTVEVSYSRRFGRSTIDVDVRAGETVHVYYFARVMLFVPGWIRVDEPITDAPGR